MVLDMPAPEELRGLARSGLREIGCLRTQCQGRGWTAVFYLLDARRLYRGKLLQEIQEITFETGMMWKRGLDINDPQESHFLRVLPRMDIDVDLGEKWEMAERLMDLQ